MRRSGFTMVELIFVIVIIGVLAAIALPKFDNVNDKAKGNTELSSLYGIESAITAEVEFRYDDFGDTNVNWHGMSDTDFTDEDEGNKAGFYAQINSDGDVLQKIMKKGENIQIAGFWGSDGADIVANADGPSSNDILILKGPASNVANGVPFNTDVDGGEIPGKPDRNDFWVFNPNNFDINITGDTDLLISPTVVAARSIVLVDMNDTDANLPTNLDATPSSGGITSNDYTVVN